MTARPAADQTPAAESLILAFVAACALMRAFAMVTTGFKGDEAYTLVISRTLALSYFDHPPLHQWLLHGFVALFGESRWARAPFWAMIVAANVPMYGLTRRLFGRSAAYWSLFAFNAATYTLVLPDGYLVPDMPLQLFLLSAAWAMAEILFGPVRSAGRTVALWLAVGVALGLAGLSKYSAAFAPLGFLGFLLGSPKHRRWLWDPRPYLAALAALAIFSPAIIWNHQNGWLSFSFQASRAAPHRLSFDVKSFGRLLGDLGTQIAMLSPWVGVPVVLALARAARTRDADSGERFLLWLVAPPLALFLLMPLFGHGVLPHWFASAWLFAFPLVGEWLSEKSGAWLQIWGRWTAALTATTLVVYILAVNYGVFWLMSMLPADARDPTELTYDWQDISQTPAWAALGRPAPAFVVVDNWRFGGKVGEGLGPKIPVCALSGDPREFAFTCDTAKWIGKDAAIIVLKRESDSRLEALAPYFTQIDAAQEFAVGRRDRAEQTFVMARGRALTRPFAFPYGPYRYEALN
jgi:hypothetical protein